MKSRLVASLIIALSFFLSIYTNAYASVEQTRASGYLSSYSASVEVEGEGSISVSYLVFATSVADEVGAEKIVIQRKDGLFWNTVKTYESTTMSESLGYKCLFKDGKVTYHGSSGYQYRAIVTVYAKIGSGSDSRIVTTSTVSP